ncbi:Uncharacterised protein [Klebsiella pneumoniae]|nr:Uncharacterised protein [Klebsiella pneumoniae]
MFIMQFRQRFTVEADIHWPDVGKGIINNLPALAGTGRCVNFNIAKTAQNGDIVNTVVGAGQWTVAGARVQPEQFDVGVVVANVDLNLFIST